MFALLVDDTKDISKTEQTSIVLRYFDKSNNSIIERFLGFFQPNGLDAESLVICITDALKKHNVNINNCIAQAYDGASVMSGDIGGVQRKIQELVPHAIYVHCYAHRVNLVLVNVCKNESIARDFFDIVQSLYVYMSSAVPHAQFLATQAGIDYNNVVIELKRIIDTRWTCQYAAIASIRRTFAAILKTLEELSVSGGDRALMAIGLLHQIQNFKFILSLEMFHSLFQLTTTLAESLQNSSVLISTAQKLVSAVSSNLQAFRDKPDAWAGIWAASVAVCEAHAIPVEHEVLPTEGIRPRRKRKIPQALNEFVVEASIEQQNDLTTSHQYKTQLFFPILDRILQELQRRFAPVNEVIHNGVDALLPTSPTFLEVSVLEPFALHYKAIIFDSPDNNLSRFRGEITTAKFLMEDIMKKQTPEVKKLLSTVDVYEEIKKFGTFRMLMSLLQISMSLPVSTASCERSFSCLKRLKNYLRSTMGHERLTSLALISIERDQLQLDSLDSIVDKFKHSSMQTRRILL